MDMGGLQNKGVFIVSPGPARIHLVLGTGTISCWVTPEPPAIKQLCASFQIILNQPANQVLSCWFSVNVCIIPLITGSLLI